MKTLVILLCSLTLILPLAAKPMPSPAAQPDRLTRAKGSFARVDIQFEVPDLQGNPFDFTENDIVAAIRQPDGSTVKIPAFFDGGNTWRVRFTPTQPGNHAVAEITRNGKTIQPVALSRSAFVATGSPKPGFVRRDPGDAHHLILDNGKAYYPIGNNVAWDTTSSDTVEMALTKMGRAGENWARIWMDHWDHKNLDWVAHQTVPLGTLDLGVAKRWDSVVSAAEKGGIRFQMVLQHHGQYSSGTDSDWSGNPWNAANGGFLSRPEEFFSNPRAIALTKAKYRYIVARWGYSPSIMAWELFNEVQWTDAYGKGDRKTVTAWHNEMADFLRRQDPYKHLITSSFSTDANSLGNRLDFWQPHIYTPDPLSAVTRLNGLQQDRPAFIGEIGPKGNPSVDDATFLRRALWGSLMSESSGAAQYWDWHVVDANDLYKAYRSATAFLRWSGLPEKRGLKALAASVETSERGPLSFGPGGDWETAKQTEYEVTPSGDVNGLGGMPRFLQGDGNRAMFPHATFDVKYTKPGKFTVRIGQVSKAGAKVVLSLDGKPLSSREFEAGDNDLDVDASVDMPVPAGRHAIRLENTGKGWVSFSAITLDPYGYRLGVAGKGNRDYAVLWVYNRGDTPSSGTLKVPRLRPGSYRVRWWDPDSAKPIRTESASVAASGILTLATPPISRDVAVVIARETGR